MTNFTELKKAEKFVAIANLIENAEMKEFLMKESESTLNRNANKTTSPSALKKKAEHEEFKSKIMEVLLGAGKPLQCKDIGDILGVSASKVSAHIRKMPEVHRSEVKKIAFFSL